MKTAHTPGPWQADRRQILAPDITFDNGLRVVAETWSGGCADLAEADANERLIAAAPELLRALTELVVHTVNLELCVNVQYSRVTTQALKAIALASMKETA